MIASLNPTPQTLSPGNFFNANVIPIFAEVSEGHPQFEKFPHCIEGGLG